MTFAINQLVWGYIIVTIDFRINGLNIIVDSIGWLMIVIALAKLPKIRDFKVAKHAATILIVLSIPNIYSSQLTPFTVPNFNEWSILTGFSQLLLMFVGVNLLSGFSKIITKGSNLVAFLENLRMPYLLIQTMAAFALLSSFVLVDVWVYIGGLFTILAIVLQFILIWALNKVKREVADDDLSTM